MTSPSKAQPASSLARPPTEPEHGLVMHFLLLWWTQTCIIASYLWLFLRTRLLRAAPPQDELDAIHRRNARRFKATASRLKGANVKLGQIASMQAHLLPQAVVEELRSLRDGVTPTDPKKVLALIESELGRPISELFASLDEVPMATASMGQVHRARLRNGHEVVIKVLHPGLEKTVEIDLTLMRWLLRVFRLFLPERLDPMIILTETESSLRNELDLSHEGRATEALGNELAPLGVIVPGVHWETSTSRVLTLDFIVGVNVDNRAQLEAWNVDRERLMTLYFQSFIHQAFFGGFFHADPHPGNVFCTPDGRLALLDFGMVQRLPENVRVGLMKEALGGFFANARLWADGLIQKGAFGEADRKKLEVFGADAFQDPRARAVIFDHRVDSQQELSDVVRRFAAFFQGLETLKAPRDNVMFMRALGIVIDVINEVLPEKTPSQLAAPIMVPVLMEFAQRDPDQYLEMILSSPPIELSP
jgi:predicted unusual protein kinase regulating ubiquinone biosynthesis (AarF/ABC1/UbiB family)